MQIVPITRTINSAGQEEVSVTFRAEESDWALHDRLLARGRKQYDHWSDITTPDRYDSKRALDAIPHADKSLQDDLLGIEYNTARFVTIIDPATGGERKFTEPVRRIRFDLVSHPVVTATCYRPEDLPLFLDLLDMLGVQVEESQAEEASSPPVEKAKSEARYWQDIYRQAQASGNKTEYLRRKGISRQTYYDAIKKHNLHEKPVHSQPRK